MTTLMDLIDEYWDLAWSEGRRGVSSDTRDGDAQRVRSAIDAKIKQLSARRATADVTEALRTKLEYMVKSYDALDDYDNGWRDACSEILAWLQKP